jgi:predicted phosphodiesterase
LGKAHWFVVPKLLLFSDLHTDLRAASSIVQQSAAVDFVVGAGDFANMRNNLHPCINVLKAIRKPTILVAGNGESTEELSAACRGWSAAHVLHGTGVTLDGLTFFGVGGGIPVTPFGEWSYDFSEEQAQRCWKSVRKELCW